MLCEAVKSYLANAKGVPFFYAVGDENYNQILSELKQNSVIVDRISDFCPKDDKFPDIDDVIDYFRTLDTDYRQNKHVLIGLGEYLALRGSAFAEKILRRLDKTTLGTARVVLKKQCDLIIELLNADEVYCDRRLGTTIQLYISDADNTQSISVVIDEKRYAAKGSDKTHYEVNLYDMRRAKKNVSAAIYDGDDLIGTVHFDIKGKMATVNNDFDDLF